jgi:amino acid transporter
MPVQPIPSLTDSSPITSNAATPLRGVLGHRDLLAYGLAYIAPVAPLSTFGLVWNASGGMVALAYLLGAVCMYFTARSYAEMSGEMPGAGSVYTFARNSLGTLAGHVVGWLILLDYLLIPSLVFLLMAAGMESLIPQVSRTGWLLLLVGTSFALGWHGVMVASRACMAAVVGQFLVVGAVLGLALWALYGSGQGGGALRSGPFYRADAFNWHGLFSAASICVFSFLGFDAVSTLSEEVRGRDGVLVGRAIVQVLLICAMLFVLTAWVLGSLMHRGHPRDEALAVYELLGDRVGPWAGVALAWGMALTAGIAGTLPMQAGVARVLFAMGRDRQLPAALGRLHPRRGTPHVAMIVATAVSLAVALLMRDRIEVLASFVNFGALGAFCLLHVSVLTHFRRSPRRQWFAHVAGPLAGLAVMGAVLAGLHPAALKMGAAWLAIGLVLGAWRGRQRRLA